MRFNRLNYMQNPQPATVVLYLKSSQTWLHISFFRLKILYKRCLSQLEECSLSLHSGLHSSNSLSQQSILNLSKKTLLFPAILPILGTGRIEELWFPNSDESSDPDPQQDVKMNLLHLRESGGPVRAVRWADKALRCSSSPANSKVKVKSDTRGSINNT